MPERLNDHVEEAIVFAAVVLKAVECGVVGVPGLSLAILGRITDHILLHILLLSGGSVAEEALNHFLFFIN